MFKLSDYIKDAFATQGENRINPDDVITINLEVNVYGAI